MKKFILLIIALCLGTVITKILIMKPVEKNGATVKTEIESSNKIRNYAQSVKSLNTGWDNIEAGDSYRHSGNYNLAIEHYKKAYAGDPRNRVFSGKILIEAYEANSQYDEALQVVDDILKNQNLADVGVKRFKSMRSHLLALQAASQEK